MLRPTATSSSRPRLIESLPRGWGTNDRKPMTDYLPEPGPDRSTPKQISLP